MGRRTLIVVIGSAFLPEDEALFKEKYVKKQPTVSNAQYERKLINGFLKSKSEGEEFVCIAAPALGGWPFYSKKLWVRGFQSNDYLKSVPYCCLYGFANFFKTLALKREIRKLLKNKGASFSSIHIIAGEAHLPYLKAIECAKKKDKRVFSTLIVPDLPSDVRKTRRPLYRLLKNRDVQKIAKTTEKYVDSFLCFTPNINKRVNRSNKPSLVLEGIIEPLDASRAKPIIKKGDKLINCVYVGKVDRRNGINVILEAAKIAPENLVFNIYGSGDSDEAIKKAQLANLHFYGFISPSEVDDVLGKADVFLSPRLPEGEYIKNSFPSKIFEYLAYKKPIVTYELPCYFKELDNVLVFPKGFTAYDLIQAIRAAVDSSAESVSFEKILRKYNNANVAKQIKSLNNI